MSDCVILGDNPVHPFILKILIQTINNQQFKNT